MDFAGLAGLDFRASGVIFFTRLPTESIPLCTLSFTVCTICAPASPAFPMAVLSADFAGAFFVAGCAGALVAAAGFAAEGFALLAAAFGAAFTGALGAVLAAVFGAGFALVF